MAKKKKPKYTKEEEAKIVAKLPVFFCGGGKMTKKKVDKFIELLRKNGEL